MFADRIRGVRSLPNSPIIMRADIHADPNSQELQEVPESQPTERSPPEVKTHSGRQLKQIRP